MLSTLFKVSYYIFLKLSGNNLCSPLKFLVHLMYFERMLCIACVHVNKYTHVCTHITIFSRFLVFGFPPHCGFQTAYIPLLCFGVVGSFKPLQYFLSVANLLRGGGETSDTRRSSCPWGYLTKWTTWCEFWHKPSPQMFWWYVGQ